MRLAKLGSLLFLLPYCTVSHAQQPSAQPEKTAAAKRPLQSDLSILGFTVGKTTMADIEAKLGKASRYHSPDEHEVEEVCYVSSSSDKTTIQFKTGWEGGWGGLVSFVVTSGAGSKKWLDRCRTTSQVTARLATPNGLHLGMNKNAIVAKFGPPHEIKNGAYLYHWARVRKATPQELQNSIVPSGSDLSEVTEIKVTFSKGKVTSFSGYYSETL